MSRPAPRGCRLAAALATTFHAACSVPTDIPVIDSRWVFEAKSTTIGVEGFLPSGVSVSGDAFAVEIDPLTSSSTLGALCPECAVAEGRRVPKPAFTGRFTGTATLPSDVSSAELASGRMILSLFHDFGFDPLRPPGGSPGNLTVAMRETGGRTVGQLRLDGASDSLPSGRAVEHEITLAEGTVGAELSMEIVMNSPIGDTADARHFVEFAAADQVRATAAPQDIRMSSARVDARGREATIEAADIGVEGIDDAIVERIQSGAIVLDIANPFGVGLDAEMRITRDGEIVVAKDFVVTPSARSSASVALTAEEFRTFLGRAGVALGGVGVVSSSPPGGIVVAPDMEVAISSKVDLTLRVGG